jgi:hypothetical protein
VGIITFDALSASAQVDLPALLGVDLVHCERQAAAAVDAGGGALRSVQGELITQGYFDGLAAEIDELLQARRRLLCGAVGAQSRCLRAREGCGAGVLLSGHACRASSIWHVHVPHGESLARLFYYASLLHAAMSMAHYPA